MDSTLEPPVADTTNAAPNASHDGAAVQPVTATGRHVSPENRPEGSKSMKRRRMGPSISADISAIANSAGALPAAISDASAIKARSYQTVQDARVAAANKIATERWLISAKSLSSIADNLK